MADPQNIDTGGGAGRPVPPPRHTSGDVPAAGDPAVTGPATAAGSTGAGVMGPAGASTGGVATAAARRGDRSVWNWLLLIPVVVPLITTLYNAKTPVLWGFPRFYWLQLAFVVLGVLVTTVVYQATKNRG